MNNLFVDYNYYWIGATNIPDTYYTGSYTWIWDHGESWSYTNWYYGGGYSYSKQCVYITPSGSDYWYTSDCSYSRRYICQISYTITTTITCPAGNVGV
jgi:hypothetical protein